MWQVLQGDTPFETLADYSAKKPRKCNYLYDQPEGDSDLPTIRFLCDYGITGGYDADNALVYLCAYPILIDALKAKDEKKVLTFLKFMPWFQP